MFAITKWRELLDKEREIQQGKNIADVAKVVDLLSVRVTLLTKNFRNSMSSISSGAAPQTIPRVRRVLQTVWRS